MDVLVVVDEEQSRHRAPESGIHESDPADEPHVVPERAHAPRLVTRAAQRGAERRGDEHRHQRERNDGHEQREVVERSRAVQVDAEGRRPREAAQPVVAVGDRNPAVSRAPQHLRQRERQHEESEAGCAQRDPAERAGDERRREERDRRGGPVAESRLQRHPRPDIGREPEPRGVSERRQAAVADEEIEACGKNRGDEDLAREVDVVLSGPQRKSSQDDDGERHPCHALHISCRPKRPVGRKAMTTIIGRKRITYARSGSSAVPKV